MRIVYNGEERGACPGTLASSCFVTYRPSSSKTYTVTAPTWSLNMSARSKSSCIIEQEVVMAHAAVRPHHAANHFFILSLIYPCFSFNILSFVLFPFYI